MDPTCQPVQAESCLVCCVRGWRETVPDGLLCHELEGGTWRDWWGCSQGMIGRVWDDPPGKHTCMWGESEVAVWSPVKASVVGDLWRSWTGFSGSPIHTRVKGIRKDSLFCVWHDFCREKKNYFSFHKFNCRTRDVSSFTVESSLSLWTRCSCTCSLGVSRFFIQHWLLDCSIKS